MQSQWCTNRPSAVYQLNISLDQPETCAKLERISQSDRSARSPRVDTQPAGSKHLYYLSNQCGYQHDSCASLHRRSWPLSDPKSGDTLVDSVYDSSPSRGCPNPFPGIYAANLSDSCFLLLRDDQGMSISYLVLTSAWRSQIRITLVRARDGEISSAEPSDFASFRLLGTDGLSLLLGVRSGPGTLPELMLGNASLDVNKKVLIVWKSIKAWKAVLSDTLQGEIPVSMHQSAAYGNDCK